MRGERLRLLEERLKFLVRFGLRYWRESAVIDAGRASPKTRLRDIVSGFHPNEADWYRQIHGTAAGYINNFEREVCLRAVNGVDGYLVDSKYALAQMLKAWDLPSPQLFALGAHGRWSYLPGGRSALDELIAEDKRFVIKPVRGRKGRGFRVAGGPDALDFRPEEPVLATALLENAGYARSIFPGSLNTIRVLMLRDESGEAFIGAAMHRFGSERSGPVDNFSAGGVVARVDTETGRLDRAVSIGEGNDVRFTGYHPDTNEPIEGAQVEGWTKIIGLVEHLGAAMPTLSYVGWDIAVTPEGPFVIEGNSHPSLRFFQFYEHVARNGRNRQFFTRRLPHRGDL